MVQIVGKKTTDPSLSEIIACYSPGYFRKMQVKFGGWPIL
jgi:hypothetical protein